MYLTIFSFYHSKLQFKLTYTIYIYSRSIPLSTCPLNTLESHLKLIPGLRACFVYFFLLNKFLIFVRFAPVCTELRTQRAAKRMNCCWQLRRLANLRTGSGWSGKLSVSLNRLLEVSGSRYFGFQKIRRRYNIRIRIAVILVAYFFMPNT